MNFEPQKQDSSAVTEMIERLKAAEGENYYLRLGRTSRQLGEFILNHCDITEKERFGIEEFIRNLDAGRI